MKKIEPEIKLKEEKEIPEPPIEEIIDNGEQEAPIQTIIDALEDGITKLEIFDKQYDFKQDKVVAQLIKTVVLICKILAVELNKTLSTLDDTTYIS